jgi:integrase
VSPRTFERYQEIVKRRWISALGSRHLAQLTASDIKNVETDWLKTGREDKTGGLSARTVRHFHWVLTSALDEAVTLRLMPHNPARQVKPPRPQNKPIVWLEPHQLASLIEATAGERLHIPVLLAATAGLRRGEVLALKWANVDIGQGWLSVTHSLEQTKVGGLRQKSPKSGAGRTIALPTMTVEALQEHAIKQKRERLKRGPSYQDNDLVCPNTIGTYWEPRNLSRAFHAFIAKNNLPPVTFHGLRHTHFTHLLKQGVHPKVASERAGHSSISITLDVYSHAIPNMQRDAADLIDDLMRGIGSKK